MLYNGFGDHNIQGIGDKHIPLIHNVTNTDLVVGVSDDSTNRLDILFNTPAGKPGAGGAGRGSGARRRMLVDFGYSSICNALAAITAAKVWGLGSDDVIMTVATDGSDLYNSDRERIMSTLYPGGFDVADGPRCVRRPTSWASPRTPWRWVRSNAQPGVQPRLLHLGRTTGRVDPRLRGAPIEHSWWDGLRSRSSTGGTT